MPKFFFFLTLKKVKELFLQLNLCIDLIQHIIRVCQGLDVSHAHVFTIYIYYISVYCWYLQKANHPYK